MTYEITLNNVMPHDRASALCLSLGLDPARTVSITLAAGKPVRAVVLDESPAR